MTSWHGTLKVSHQHLDALDTFIHEPDTRQGDIFDQGTLTVDRHQQIDWIIKHDLYEGVVVHFSLMKRDAVEFLKGTEKTLRQASDLMQQYTLEHDDRAYEIMVSEES